MNEILKAREERGQLIREKYRGFPLLTIKANTPGTKKNLPRAKFLVDYFGKLIEEKFPLNFLEIYGGADGPWVLAEFSEHKNYKPDLIEIEDQHPLGRLIDLDFFLESEKSSSRSELGLSLRRCLVCSQDAVICARLQKHSLWEINLRSEEILESFFVNTIRKLLDEAITMEASLDPKFGLVTALSSGAHPDMDFALMMRAKSVIIEPLMEMFVLGYREDLATAFQKARQVGVVAEERMYRETGNVNCYKGLIFIIGIVLVALGHSLHNYPSDFYAAVRQIGCEAEKDFTKTLPQTNGLRAYLNYGIKGIRGEASAGLPNVKKALSRLTDFSRETLLMTLIGLIRDVEDTVLLKRAGSLEKYHHYRKLIGSIEVFDEERIKNLTAECIENNLSFGGSADLLIVTIFLKKVEGCLKLNYEDNSSDRSV